MVTKEKIIDRMPNDLLEKVYKYINGLTSDKKKFPTYKLKGQFDNINARDKASE